MSSAKIKEIFTSIQGEGPYVGYKQLFVRFCGCNLKCSYCDTDFSVNGDYIEYDVDNFLQESSKYNDVHSVSLTGGEPLLWCGFLKEVLPRLNKKIYLETNATMYNELLKIKPFIDIVSADIKLESATGIKNSKELHEKFFENCRGVETFAKIVFNDKITEKEIEICTDLGKNFGIELILQPEMREDKMTISSKFASNILDKFLKSYDRVRLIPQVHKFLDVR